MIAEGLSALADTSLGHGVALILEPGLRPIVGVPAPIPPSEFEGRIAQEVAAAVIVSVQRSEFAGIVAKVGQSFRDPAAGFTYRVLSVEDLPSRPHVVFVCEAAPTTP